MRKTITSWVTLLVALVLAVPASAQEFWEKIGDPVTQIEENVNYLLEDPWTSNDLFLSNSGSVKYPLSQAVWNFIKVSEDTDGTPIYRLKNVATGEFLMNPVHTGGAIKTSGSQPQAVAVTCMLGNGLDQFQDENQQTTEEWKNADQRCVYYKGGQEHENVFVIYNTDAKSDKKFVCAREGSNVGSHIWHNYVDARILHIYATQKAGVYDNFCESMNMLYPSEEYVNNLYATGKNPGEVAENLVNEFKTAYQEAIVLVDDNTQADNVYTEALERLNAAKQACEEGINPLTPGFYVIDNNPAAGRANYAGTNNACLTETKGELHWAGFDKPEVMTVEGASFIWEVTRTDEVENGWYLRNYGTDRYAGSKNQNYQCVPSTETASQVYTITRRAGKFFSIDMVNQKKDHPSLHADQNTDKKIVIWGPYAGASQWAFLPVDASELEGIESALEQNRINKAAKALYVQASEQYVKGFEYSTPACSRDSIINNDGLIKAEDQLVSNAPESPDNEPGNAYINLIDGNFETYFHTVWSSADYASSYHYLDVRLDEAIECFNIKYAKRHNGNGNGSPVKIHVFASNDTTGGNWTDQGYMFCTYPYATTYVNEEGSSVKKNNFIGVAGCKLDNKYTYIRMQVEATAANSLTNGNLFWYWSELRMYPASYDASISLIEAVPADIRKNFEDCMATVKAELAADKVQKVSYEALQAAYDKFMEHYPDPQALKNAINDAKAKGEAATQSEGDAIGFYQEGAGAALLAVVEEVSATLKPVMTIEEINAGKAKLEKAIEELNAKLIIPETDLYVYIKCATQSEAEGSAKDQYLYAQNNDKSQVKFGSHERMYDRPEFIWKIIKNDDNSYSFINLATGTYLGNPVVNNAKVNMEWEADSVRLGGTNVGGVFNMICSKGVYYNTQPGTGNLVTWNSATGSDNSAFIFEPYEDFAGEAWDTYSVHHDFSGESAEIISKPFTLGSFAEGALLYKVLGMKDGKLQLALYGDNEIIPAGTPFIAMPDGEPNADGNYQAVLSMEGDYKNISYVFEGQKQGGMLAAIQSTDKVAGCGILYNNNVVKATETDKVKSHSGYFVEMPAETTEDGEITMEFPESIETGIIEVIVNTEKTGVYSLTGVKVRNNANTKGLPKGLYIVGGQKVLVK